MVRCACGREFNAGKVKACPVCGAFARFAEPVAVSAVSPASSAGKATRLMDDGQGRLILSALEQQISLLKSIRIGVFVFGVLITLNTAVHIIR